MAESFSLGVLSALVGTLSTSEPQFHPRTIVPMDQSPQERLSELYEELDQSFKDDPIYASTIMPLGSSSRPWITPEERPLGDGIVTEYAKKTLLNSVKGLQRTGKNLYEANVSPIDQELIQFGIHTLQRLGDLKVWWLGPFRLEQGRFFFAIENFDYLRALQQATHLADVGFDRLKGHKVRLDALETCDQKTQEDKTIIRNKMGAFLTKSEQELELWWKCSLDLRTLIDLRHHIADLCHILYLHINQKGPIAITQIHYELWLLDALDSELQASFHEVACSRRLYHGQFSRAVETASNWFANIFVGDAKEPRPFESVVESAKKRIKESEASLKGFKEHEQSTEQQRLQSFKEAIEQDYFLLARQIALNAQALSEYSYNWEGELYRLKDYKDLTATLAEIQDHFFISKRTIAHKLKDENKPELAKLLIQIDEAEYNTFQLRLLVKDAYQGELTKALQGMEGIFDQVKQSAFNVAIAYLLRNQLGDSKSPLIEVMNLIRKTIATYCGYLREVDVLLGSAPQDKKEKEPVMPENAKKEEILPVNVQDGRANFDAIDELALQAYQHFNTPEDYHAFVTSMDFDDPNRIGIAIIFCRKNGEAQAPYWNWAREQQELEDYRRLRKLIDTKNNSSDEYKGKLRTELRESFRRKVLSDFNEHLSTHSTSMRNTLTTSVTAGIRSMARKGVRLYTDGVVFNPYGDFRDPKFQMMFSCKLNSEENAFNFDTLISPSPLSEERDERREQKVFSPAEYIAFIEGAEFRANPGLAFMILKHHVTEGPEAEYWDWDREMEDLKKYCFYLDQLKKNVAKIPNADQVKEKLINSFIKKVRSDHSEYRTKKNADSYVASAGNVVNSITQSAIRKGARLLTLQSPINSAANFRDEVFQRKMEEALGLSSSVDFKDTEENK